MKKLVQVLIIVVCSLVIFTSSAVADVDNVNTKWKNQRGSTLDLIIDSEKVSGTFTTKVGCGIDIPRKVIGTRSKKKNVISS